VKIELPRQIFEKPSNIKFHENPSCGNRVVSCGQKTNGQEGRMNAAKKISYICA